MERLIALSAGCLLGLACGSGEAPAEAPAAPVAEQVETVEEIEPAPEPEPYPAGLAPFVEPWKGDLDGMIERRFIRVLTVQNPVLYFIDRGRELGITYEGVKWFNHVELITAKRIGRETVQYVANIYKYYLAYQMVIRQEELRKEAKGTSGGQ